MYSFFQSMKKSDQRRLLLHCQAILDTQSICPDTIPLTHTVNFIIIQELIICHMRSGLKGTQNYILRPMCVQRIILLYHMAQY